MPLEVSGNPDGGASLDASYAPLWYVIRSEYRQEYAAFVGISSLGFRAHLPRYVSRKPGHAPKTLVLFPRYLFVEFDVDFDQWRRVAKFGHVFSTTPERPIPLRPGVVEELMSRGRAGDGVIDDRAPAFPRLAPGSAIRVTSGAFADWRGVLRWSDEQRVRVLLELMGAPREVTMPRASVAGV